MKLSAGVNAEVLQSHNAIPELPDSLEGVLFVEGAIRPERELTPEVELIFVKGPDFPLDPTPFILKYLGNGAVRRSRPILVDFEKSSDLQELIKYCGFEESGFFESESHLLSQWIQDVASIGQTLFQSNLGNVRIDANDGTRIGHAAYFHSHHSRRLLASFDNQSSNPTLIGPGVEEDVLDRFLREKSQLIAAIAQAESVALHTIERQNLRDFRGAYQNLKAVTEEYFKFLFGIRASDTTGTCQSLYRAPKGLMAFSSKPWTSWTQNHSISSAFTHAEPPVVGEPRGMLVIDFD